MVPIIHIIPQDYPICNRKGYISSLEKYVVYRLI